MAITICGAVPLIVAYFRSSKTTKAKEFDEFGGSSRESMDGEKQPESERRTSIISSLSGRLLRLVTTLAGHLY